MCPACMATAAVIAAGATSTGGLAVFTVKKVVKTLLPNVPPPPLPLEQGGHTR